MNPHLSHLSHPPSVREVWEVWVVSPFSYYNTRASWRRRHCRLALTP